MNPFDKKNKTARTPIRSRKETNSNEMNNKEREAAEILSNLSQSQVNLNEEEVETSSIVEIDPENNPEGNEQDAICKICETAVIDEALECDLCKEWWHGDCMGVTTEDITQIGILGKKNVLWICKVCREDYNEYKEKQGSKKAKEKESAEKEIIEINLKGL